LFGSVKSETFILLVVSILNIFYLKFERKIQYNTITIIFSWTWPCREVILLLYNSIWFGVVTQFFSFFLRGCNLWSSWYKSFEWNRGENIFNLTYWTPWMKNYSHNKKLLFLRKIWFSIYIVLKLKHTQMKKLGGIFYGEFF